MGAEGEVSEGHSERKPSGKSSHLRTQDIYIGKIGILKSYPN